MVRLHTRLIVACVLMILVCATAGAQSIQPGWQAIPQGQLILRPFQYAPYPHASREQGFKGRATTYPAAPHYTDSTVGVFIPSGYVAGKTVDYVVHFHGHNNHVSKVIPQYKLAEQFVGTKVNAILIVPQGPKDAADSGGGKLEIDPGGFERLIEEVTGFLQAEGKLPKVTVGRIVLSTHSGGYKVTAAILDHGGLADHITDVLMLDSSYGSLEQYEKWIAASPSHRLVSLYTQHLAAANKELMGLLDKDGVKYRELEEATVSDEQLAGRGTAFMPTKVQHDLVPVEYFGRLVGSSALARQE